MHQQALEQRLRAGSGSGYDLARRRQLLIFDRFLARIVRTPPTLQLYPVPTHIAEKLHAYTMPRQRENSRVKDLPDLALLASIGSLEANRLAKALEQTFTFRETHARPLSLPDPHPAWEKPYMAMARADQLAWSTLAEVTTAARTFLEPILAGERASKWDPALWRWV